MCGLGNNLLEQRPLEYYSSVAYLYCCTVYFVQSFNYHTNKCTYIQFHINTLKIAPTCFDPKSIFRELHCSLLKSQFLKTLTDCECLLKM